MFLVSLLSTLKQLESLGCRCELWLPTLECGVRVLSLSLPTGEQAFGAEISLCCSAPENPPSGKQMVSKMLVIKKVSKEDPSTAFSAGFATAGALPSNGSKAPITGSSVYKNLVPKPAVTPIKVRKPLQTIPTAPCTLACLGLLEHFTLSKGEQGDTLDKSPVWCGYTWKDKQQFAVSLTKVIKEVVCYGAETHTFMNTLKLPNHLLCTFLDWTKWEKSDGHTKNIHLPENSAYKAAAVLLVSFSWPLDATLVLNHDCMRWLNLCVCVCNANCLCFPRRALSGNPAVGRSQSQVFTCQSGIQSLPALSLQPNRAPQSVHHSTTPQKRWMHHEKHSFFTSVRSLAPSLSHTHTDTDTFG